MIAIWLKLLSQGATQRVLDATQLYLGEIGYSPLLTAEKSISRVAHCVVMSLHAVA